MIGVEPSVDSLDGVVDSNLDQARTVAARHDTTGYAEFESVLDRVDAVLDTENSVPERGDPSPLPCFSEKIVYQNVSFSYPNTERQALKNIDLEIEKGKIVALVGASGAGKSTLADLLPRFYDPSEGAVLIDGHDLRDLSLTSLRGLMGIVTQEAILFNDTVFNNIAFGSAALPAAVEAAARAANAHEFIEKMGLGYQSTIPVN